jgi:hypothetical protein
MVIVIWQSAGVCGNSLRHCLTQLGITLSGAIEHVLQQLF